MKIETILSQIDLGAMALPEFQRGYVWNREQVRGLMQSLDRRHPVGGLLVWVTESAHADHRGDEFGSRRWRAGRPFQLGRAGRSQRPSGRPLRQDARRHQGAPNR